jgi:RNA polymerase sigma factor (sigma-70 family)
MQKWQRERNYRKRQSADGAWTYLIEIDGAEVEVTKEVHEAYAAYDRRERYQAERDEGRLLALERMKADGASLLSAMDVLAMSAEDTFFRKFESEALTKALASLEPKDRHMVEALILDGVTEREYAAEIGIAQKNVNKKKQRILLRLRKILSV